MISRAALVIGHESHESPTFISLLWVRACRTSPSKINISHFGQTPPMARSALDEMTESGAFNRTASTFRNFISRDEESPFPAEAGRYHLYVSYACPWASRCLAFLKMKGLGDAISYTVSRTIKLISGNISNSRTSFDICIFK